MERLKEKEGISSLPWPKGSKIPLISHLSAGKTCQLSWYRNGATPLSSISVTLVSAEVMTWGQYIEGTLYHLTFI